MLKRYFLSNILFVLFANVLIKPLWMFGVDRNVQLLVGHEVYGNYTAILGLCVVFAIMLDMGVTNYNNLMVAGDKDKIHASLPNLLVVKLVLSIGYFVVLTLLAWILHYPKATFTLLWLICGAQILSSFIIYLRSNISANHDFKTDALLSIVDKVIMIITCSLWLLGYFNTSSFTIYVFVGLQILAYVITLLLCLLFIRKKYTRISWQYFSVSHTLALFKKSFPYAVLIFLMGIYMRGDAVLLERLAGPAETGLFANAFRILDVSNTLGVLVAGVLLPMFSRLITQQDKIGELVQVSARLLIPVTLALSLFCVFHAQRITIVLYHDSSSYTALIFAAMMLSFPAYSIQYIFSTLLTAEQSLGLLNKMAFMGCILSVGLNVILIHVWKAEGAAIASSAVQWILACTSLWFASKHFRFKLNLDLLVRLLLFTSVLALVNWYLAHLNFGLPILVLIHVVMVPLVFLASGIMKVQSIWSYIRKNSGLS